MGVVANVLSSVGDGINRQQLIPLGLALTLGVFVEAVILASRPADVSLFAASQLDLIRRVPEYHKLIGEATEVLLLGGTMKTLTDDSRTVEAIRDAVREGKFVRILLMHPFGGGVESTGRARRAAGKSTTDNDLRAEIKSSVGRLVDCCGPSIQHSIRLYREQPTYSMLCMGSKWVLTVYTMGRGASSPAVYFTESEPTTSFADGLRHGFEELWRAPTTSSLDWPKSFEEHDGGAHIGRPRGELH